MNIEKSSYRLSIQNQLANVQKGRVRKKPSLPEKILLSLAKNVAQEKNLPSIKRKISLSSLEKEIHQLAEKNLSLQEDTTAVALTPLLQTSNIALTNNVKSEMQNKIDQALDQKSLQGDLALIRFLGNEKNHKKADFSYLFNKLKKQGRNPIDFIMIGIKEQLKGETNKGSFLRSNHAAGRIMAAYFKENNLIENGKILELVINPIKEKIKEIPSSINQENLRLFGTEEGKAKALELEEQIGKNAEEIGKIKKRLSKKIVFKKSSLQKKLTLLENQTKELIKQKEAITNPFYSHKIFAQTMHDVEKILYQNLASLFSAKNQPPILSDLKNLMQKMATEIYKKQSELDPKHATLSDAQSFTVASNLFLRLIMPSLVNVQAKQELGNHGFYALKALQAKANKGSFYDKIKSPELKFLDDSAKKLGIDFSDVKRANQNLMKALFENE